MKYLQYGKRNSLIKHLTSSYWDGLSFNFHCHVRHNCNLKRWLTWRATAALRSACRAICERDNPLNLPSINLRWRARAARFPFQGGEKIAAQCARVSTYLSTETLYSVASWCVRFSASAQLENGAVLFSIFNALIHSDNRLSPKTITYWRRAANAGGVLRMCACIIS